MGRRAEKDERYFISAQPKLFTTGPGHRRNGRPPEIRCAGSRLHLYISVFIDADGWRGQPVVNLWPVRRFYVKKLAASWSISTGRHIGPILELSRQHHQRIRLLKPTIVSLGHLLSRPKCVKYFGKKDKCGGHVTEPANGGAAQPA